MNTLAEKWSRFWFSSAPPENLGFSRFLFFAILFIYYLPQDLSAWGSVSKVFWMPIGLFEHLRIPVFSEEILKMIEVVWKAALLLSALGLWTRASTSASFLLGTYLLGLAHNFGKTHHFDAMLIFVMGFLALSYAGDAWSIDRLIRAARGKEGASRGGESGEYTWPIRAVWVVMVTILFATGVAKLRFSGAEWIASDNMAVLLTQQSYHLSAKDPVGSLNLVIAQYGWAARAIAFATVFFETAYPLALFFTRVRWILIAGVLAMLVGIRILMGPSFELFIFCHLFWFPWNRIGFWIHRRRAIS